MAGLLEAEPPSECPNTRLVGDVAGKQSERGSICFGENAKRLPVQSGSKGAS